MKKKEENIEGGNEGGKKEKKKSEEERDKWKAKELRFKGRKRRKVRIKKAAKRKH